MALCVITPLLANEDDGSETPPSAELLAYLGQMVELDDELIGPELFDVNEETEQVEKDSDTTATSEDEAPEQGEVRHD